jgi:hypothetical protein
MTNKELLEQIKAAASLGEGLRDQFAEAKKN